MIRGVLEENAIVASNMLAGRFTIRSGLRISSHERMFAGAFASAAGRGYVGVRGDPA